MHNQIFNPELMSQSIFPGPIAPENNPPIEPQWFQPSLFPITAISYGINTTITTGTAFGVTNNYVIGQLVRMNIPFPYGAQQLNGQEAYVIGIPGPNQVTININTSIGYNPFISSPSNATTPPQIVAVGDINSGQINSTVIQIQYPPTNLTIEEGTYVPGSFINISPVQAG